MGAVVGLLLLILSGGAASADETAGFRRHAPVPLSEHELAVIESRWKRIDWAGGQPAADLPVRFSWRDHQGADWMSPVRDQGSCGSCWAFGPLAVMEAAVNIRAGDPGIDLDLAEQYVVSCGVGSCATGGFSQEVMVFLKNSGVPDEACHPYQADEGSCADACPDRAGRSLKIEAWGQVLDLVGREAAIKRRLLEGPLAVSLVLYDDFYDHESGVYSHQYGGMVGGHVVALVGWDDSNGSWICKNSWGDDFGDGGYFEIRRGDSFIALDAVWLRVGALPVVPDPPQADFGAEPRSGVAPLTVRFTDRSTGTIDRWYWQFGDGGSSTERNPVHDYRYRGNFGVSLEVAGPGGSDWLGLDWYINVTDPPADGDVEPESGGDAEPEADGDAASETGEADPETDLESVSVDGDPDLVDGDPDVEAGAEISDRSDRVDQSDQSEYEQTESDPPAPAGTGGCGPRDGSNLVWLCGLLGLAAILRRSSQERA